MKRLLLFVGFINILSLCSHAQDSSSRPFIEEGKTWVSKADKNLEYEGLTPERVAGDMDAYYWEYNYFDGDTVVDGKACKRWVQKYVRPTDRKSIEYAIPVFEEDKKVWFYLDNGLGHYWMYDFGAKVGDTIAVAKPDAQLYQRTKSQGYGMDVFMKYLCDTLVVYSVGEEVHGGKNQLTTHFYTPRRDWDQEYRRDYILENNYYMAGIGSRWYPILNHYCAPGMSSSPWLLYCTVGDDVLYLDKEECEHFHIPLPNTDYHPFIEKDKVWTVQHIDATTGKVLDTREFYFGADTVIADKVCKFLMCRTKMEGITDVITTVAPLFEDERSVFFFQKNPETQVYDNTAQVLYDFNVRDGQSRTLNLPDVDYALGQQVYGQIHTKLSSGCRFRAVETYQIQGQNVRCFCFWDEWTGNAERYNFYMEGIGSDLAPVFNILNGCPAQEFKLQECRVGDQILYTAADNPRRQIEAFAKQQEAPADDEYIPFVEDGKRWAVTYTPTQYGSSPLTRLTYYFDGDTLVNNTRCLRFMCCTEDFRQRTKTTELVFCAYEQDRQVYYFPKGTATPLIWYDFSAQRGEFVKQGMARLWSNGHDNQTTTMLVWEDIPVEKDGYSFRGKTVSSWDVWMKDAAYRLHGPESMWIEGIGSFVSPVESSQGVGYVVLQECVVGDRILYRNPDYQMIEASPTYRSFIEEDKVWKVGWCIGKRALRLASYYFDGDTIINNQACRKMMCLHQYKEGWEESGKPDVWTEYVGALYEAEKRVLCAFPKKNSFEILYDFRGETFDTVSVFEKEIPAEFSRCWIIEKGYSNSELFRGNYYKVIPYYLDESFHEEIPSFWREGVGFTRSPLVNLSLPYEAPDKFVLLTCIAGDELLYNDTKYQDEVTPATSSEVKKKWLDFTHVVKPRPKSPAQRASQADEAAEQETLKGEYSARELFVSLKTLTGAYTVTLTDAAGEVVYRKDVQTSNVVALNTLLTDYPDGEYTLTVENAEEQYTALLSLPLLDDAVRDLLYDKSVNSKSVNGKWSDLSGRHLNSQPIRKGIYIKDGRKVLIK